MLGRIKDAIAHMPGAAGFLSQDTSGDVYAIVPDDKIYRQYVIDTQANQPWRHGDIPMSLMRIPFTELAKNANIGNRDITEDDVISMGRYGDMDGSLERVDTNNIETLLNFSMDPETFARFREIALTGGDPSEFIPTWDMLGEDYSDLKGLPIVTIDKYIYENPLTDKREKLIDTEKAAVDGGKTSNVYTTAETMGKVRDAVRDAKEAPGLTSDIVGRPVEEIMRENLVDSQTTPEGKAEGEKKLAKFMSGAEFSEEDDKLTSGGPMHEPEKSIQATVTKETTDPLERFNLIGRERLKQVEAMPKKTSTKTEPLTDETVKKINEIRAKYGYKPRPLPSEVETTPSKKSNYDPYMMRGFSELYRSMSQNRRRKNEVKTDDNGRVDVVGSSTASLFAKKRAARSMKV